MKAHPFADIFPLLEGEAFEALVADIAANGLMEPITILDGMVLDGRNRLKACEAAGIEPQFLKFDGDDPLAFVLSLNVHRRHLDESQRGMVAAKLETLRHGGIRQDANLHLDRRAVAAMVNVSVRTVASAAAVRDHASPELIQAVDRGDIAVSVAAELSTSSEAIQRQAVAQPERAHVLVKQAARAEREAELGAKQVALPNKRFGVILADPPWRFEVYSEDTGQGRAAEAHYPTMRPESLAALDVPSIAADDCVLFMWATAPTMPEAFDLLKAWGFTYRSQCIWAKDKIGMGFWFRNQHEHLIVAVKGSIPAPAHGTQWLSLVHAQRDRHSEKPAVFYDLVEAYFPTLPRIELFARGEARLGWERVGERGGTGRPPIASS